MIKTFLIKLTALFIIVSVVLGCVAFMSFGLKLAINNTIGYIIIMLFTVFSILVSFLLTAQQNSFNRAFSDKISNYTDTSSDDSNFDYASLDLSTLNIKTTDLTLTEYYHRATFVESSGSSEGIYSVVEYLKSRVKNKLPYENMPLPVVAGILRMVDNNLPESTLGILHDKNTSTNDDTNEFDAFKDLDTESIN